MDQKTTLPIADPVIILSLFDWLERFAACVRTGNYAAAPPILALGQYCVWHLPVTRARSRAGSRNTMEYVWPCTADFPFDLGNTAVFASPDGRMATVITPWTSTGFNADGAQFDRPGRATIILARKADGRWVGIHSHMSLQRGVPQDSHGNRPVKAF